jgi:hypothetical protein
MGGKKGEAEEQETGLILWPEWNDAEIQSEKWASKHAFEDPDGLTLLPRSLSKHVDSVKRVSELVGDGASITVVSPLAVLEETLLSAQILDHSMISKSYPDVVVSIDTMGEENKAHGTSLIDCEYSGSRGEEDGKLFQGNTSMDSFANAKPADNEFSLPVSSDLFLSGTSKLYHVNQHLMVSDFMTTLISMLHYLYDYTKFSKENNGDGNVPWDNIYPKTKDGLPLYNASGKYIVKLYWMGCWRKITIDDRIPIDSSGKALLVCSATPNEIWPLLITKALLKVASLRFLVFDLVLLKRV